MKPFNRLAIDVASGFTTATLLFLALPPFGLWWLSWFAFVPLILAIYQRRTLPAFFIGYGCGLVAKFMIFNWLWVLSGMSPSRYLVLGLYLGAYTGLWAAVVTLLPRTRWQLLLMPAAWVMFDYIMANAGFLGTSWGSLAQSQHNNLALIQIAAFVGEYGVTFVIMFFNVALAYGISRSDWKSIGPAIILVGLVHIYGWWELSRPQGGASVRLAIIQPALAPRSLGTGSGNLEAFNILKRLSIEASKKHPDLIVWPESSFDRWKNDFLLITNVGELAQSIDTAILLGTSENQKFGSPNRNQISSEKKIFNAAFMVYPNGTIDAPYHKNILMPFGEYVPLADTNFWPGWLVPEINPLTPGSSYKHFMFKDNVYVSPIICWENGFADYVRRAITNKPSIIAQLTNDNMFGRTVESRQHNLLSVFRAVENRTPVLVASNTGPSQIIDSHGRIVSEVASLYEPGVAFATVITNSNRTFYSRFGDIFVLLITLTLALIFTLSISGRRSKI